MDAPDSADERRSPAARAALGLLDAYRVLLSPLMGGTCRFEPSCSVYAAEAIRRFGLRHGGWLAARRVARCRPFGGWGLDPVPPVSPPLSPVSESSGRTDRS
jgi:putative membrane protein insertion efficiency factor